MKPMEFTDEELEVMQQVIERRLATLEVEIRHTDHAEFKDILKHRRHVLNAILERLSQATVSAS